MRLQPRLRARNQLLANYRVPARAWHIGTVAGVMALLVAGCSGSHGPATPSTGPTGPATSSPAAAAGAGLGVTPPSAPSASGQLRVLLHDALPVASQGAASGSQVPIGAEAPDGSVFVTFGSEQAAGGAEAPAGSAVYVVDGNQPAQVAEHPTIPVTSLAADSTNLYVGGGDQIVAYDRATGNATQTWSLAQPVRLMAASAGRVWAVLGSLTGSGLVVEINPGASGFTTVGTDTADVASIAAGPQGLYYVESGGATIVHISPDGTRQQAPTNQTVNLELSGPAAVQAISVIGSTLLLIHNAGQGLDSSSQTYNASTLAGPLATAPGTAGANHAVSSLGGPVDLAFSGVCPGTSQNSFCVGRYNLSTGAVTDAVSYPQSTQLGLLLGPYPAAIVFPSSGSVYVDRIG